MAYVMSALEEMEARGVACVEVRQEVQDAFNAELEERLRRPWARDPAR